MTLPLSSADLHLVLIALIRQASIGWQAIGNDRGAWRYAPLDKRHETARRRVLDDIQPNSADGSPTNLGRNGNKRLPAANMTAASSFLYPADDRLIYLNLSRELVTTRTDHGSSQFVQPCPGGLVCAQAEDLLQVQSARTVLL
jgi:hypothetical protein